MTLFSNGLECIISIDGVTQVHSQGRVVNGLSPLKILENLGNMFLYAIGQTNRLKSEKKRQRKLVFFFFNFAVFFSACVASS